MAKGDAASAARHQHGVIHRPDPRPVLTLEQRVEKLERDAGEGTRLHGYGARVKSAEKLHGYGA